jgi:hypothetical protein
MSLEEIQKDLKELKQMVSQLNYSEWNFKNRERVKFMNRDEVLTLLLKLMKTEEELTEITNYKGLLQEELKNMGYAGRLNKMQIQEWMDKKGVVLVPMDSHMEEVKGRILELAEKRRKEYEGKRSQSHIS